MQLRLAGITKESVVDGPGIRVVIYAQGCPHRCPGCQNPKTHDPSGGRLFCVDEVIQMVRRVPIAQGVTFRRRRTFCPGGSFRQI